MQAPPAAADSCPKHMVMGPCGGVRADGRCEVVPQPCAFEVPAVWDDPVPPVPLPVAAVPLILADFSSAGRIGLLVYLATTRHLDDPPEGNHFPTTSQLSTLLHAADLEVGQEADPGAMPPPAPDWQDRVAAVERELQRRFGSTPQLAAATEQSDRIAATLGAGQLTSRVLTLRCSG